MTIQELYKLPFRMEMHLNFGDMHSTTFRCTLPELDITICDQVPYKDGEPKGRCIRHYMVNGKVYKRKSALIKAIEHIQLH